MASHEIHRAIDAVWRIESAKVIAKVARMVQEVGLAEEIAQDALVTALERWPQTGVPDNPGAWLMAVAKHRAIDHLRRRKMLALKHEELGRELEMEQDMAFADVDEPGPGDDGGDDYGDDLLRQAKLTVSGQTLVMKVSDWGKPVTITVPPASQVMKR